MQLSFYYQGCSVDYCMEVNLPLGSPSLPSFIHLDIQQQRNPQWGPQGTTWYQGARGGHFDLPHCHLSSRGFPRQRCSAAFRKPLNFHFSDKNQKYSLKATECLWRTQGCCTRLQRLQLRGGCLGRGSSPEPFPSPSVSGDRVMSPRPQSSHPCPGLQQSVCSPGPRWQVGQV